MTAAFHAQARHECCLVQKLSTHSAALSGPPLLQVAGNARKDCQSTAAPGAKCDTRHSGAGMSRREELLPMDQGISGGV
jgi:hypothetical protein